MKDKEQGLSIVAIALLLVAIAISMYIYILACEMEDKSLNRLKQLEYESENLK